MLKSEMRIERIGLSARAQAEQQAADIIRKADEFSQKELRAYREEIIEEMFRYGQKTIAASKQEVVSRVAKAEQEARTTLLRRREEITREVFAAARQKLLAYAATEGYRAALLTQAEELGGRFDCAGARLLLREEDMALESELSRILPGCRMEAAPAIKLGGFIFETGKVRLDATLEGRLEDQREWFLQACGLRVC